MNAPSLEFGAETIRAAGALPSASYAGATSSKFRKQPSPLLRSEDDVLDSAGRRRLQANARDIARNYAVAAWMIRRHLDFVASFNFQCKSRRNDDELDDAVEEFIREWSRPLNVDVTARHPLDRIIRLVEACAVVDGDVFVLKLADGRIQLVESDRVRTPNTMPAGVDTTPRQLKHGVKLDESGRALAYAVCKRTDFGGYQLERLVKSGRMIQHGYFDRYDQVRGISPVASALNPLRDLYESFDYALAKAKVAQLFALALKRDGGEGIADDLDFTSGPQLLDMGPDESAEFLESKQPSSEFQAFSKTVIAVALKALDIPLSFYDESHTNFYGSRGALMMYVKACKAKRAQLKETLRQLTIWRLRLALDDGALVLPRGTMLSDLKIEWVPDGIPWWDPAKDLRADIQAIESGLRTRTEIRKERYGDDWRSDVVPELLAEQRLIDESGLRILQPGNEIYAPEPAGGNGDGE